MKPKAPMLAAVALLMTVSAVAQSAPDLFGGQANGRSVRGTVTGIAAPFVTIKTDDGQIWQIKLGPNARLVKSGQRFEKGDSNAAAEPPEPITLTGLHIGDVLAAGGDIDPAARKLNAAFGFVLDAATVKKLAADWGVTYIAGKVTAINTDDAQITVQRPDGKVKTIQADETTSFRKRRDSITLADIKVGDVVTGRGAQKNGVFTPATLSVSDPAARRATRDTGPAGAPVPPTP